MQIFHQNNRVTTMWFTNRITKTTHWTDTEFMLGMTKTREFVAFVFTPVFTDRAFTEEFIEYTTHT